MLFLLKRLLTFVFVKNKTPDEINDQTSSVDRKTLRSKTCSTVPSRKYKQKYNYKNRNHKHVCWREYLDLK